MDRGGRGEGSSCSGAHLDVPNRLCLVPTATAAEEGSVILTVLAKDLISANTLLEEMYSWRRQSSEVSENPCVSLLGLPSSRTVKGVASTTESHCLKVLGARSPRAMCQQGRFLLRAHEDRTHSRPFSLALSSQHLPSAHVSVQIPPFYKDTRHTGLGPILMILINSVKAISK